MTFKSLNSYLLILTSALSTITWANPDIVDERKGEKITHEIGYRYTLSSKILAEERELLIHLPDEYDKTNKQYPVIYLLDGNGHFKHATTATNYLARQSHMPEAILIGITNNRGMRGRDLGKGSEKFWSYIKNEVVAFVDKNYRTSGHKTIFGHSMAGAFVMREFLKNPTWFDSHIAASPGMRNDIVGDFQHFFADDNNISQRLPGSSLYFTMAGVGAEGTENVQIVNDLATILKQKAPKEFNWGYQHLPQHAHMTTPYLTFHQGITRTFTDFQPPSIANYQEYLEQNAMEGIKNHYQQRAAKYSTNSEIPNQFIRRLGEIIFDDGHTKEAIELLIKNTENFPESIWAHNALARLYAQNNQKEKSLNIFEKALALAKNQNSPGVNYLKGEIERVKSSQQ